MRPVLGGIGAKHPGPTALRSIDGRAGGAGTVAAGVEVAGKRPARLRPEGTDRPQRLARNGIQAVTEGFSGLHTGKRVEDLVQRCALVEQGLQMAGDRLLAAPQPGGLFGKTRLWGRVQGVSIAFDLVAEQVRLGCRQLRIDGQAARCRNDCEAAVADAGGVDGHGAGDVRLAGHHQPVGLAAHEVGIDDEVARTAVVAGEGSGANSGAEHADSAVVHQFAAAQVNRGSSLDQSEIVDGNRPTILALAAAF